MLKKSFSPHSMAPLASTALAMFLAVPLNISAASLPPATVASGESLTISIAQPPMQAFAPCALFLNFGIPGPSDVTSLDFGLGDRYWGHSSTTNRDRGRCPFQGQHRDGCSPAGQYLRTRGVESVREPSAPRPTGGRACLRRSFHGEHCDRQLNRD